MNRIEKLIQKYSTKGVENKELREIGYLYGGLTGKSKSDFIDGNAKFITYMNVFTNIEVKTDIDTFVKIGNKEKQNKIEYGDVLFTGSSETPDECGMSSVLTVKTDEPLYLNSFCFGLRLYHKDLLLPGFLKYLFRDDEIRKQINKTANGVTRFNISKKLFEKIKIPIPPLPVQQEIVNILDKFTQLEEELNAELEARRKQYDFYLNQLMESEGKDVEWKTLGEICEFKYGFTDKAQVEGDVRFIRITDINEKGKLSDNEYKYIDLTAESQKYILSKGDILIARTGATFGKTMLFNKDYPAVYASFLIRIKFIDKNITPSYYWHFSQSNLYWDQANVLVGGGAQPQFNANALKSVQIPIPPISEQERIVSILDKFDALVNDTKISIPAEIEARRKQYAYYRNKLLTFGEYA